METARREAALRTRRIAAVAECETGAAASFHNGNRAVPLGSRSAAGAATKTLQAAVSRVVREGVALFRAEQERAASAAYGAT